MCFCNTTASTVRYTYYWTHLCWAMFVCTDDYCFLCSTPFSDLLSIPWEGATDLEKGYGDVRPWRPPFHVSPSVRKGPISSKSISSQGPLLKKFGNFSLYSLNFGPNLSSQAPKFGKFQLTSPQIWKLSAHKTPFSEASISSQAPHFGNPGRTPLPEKSWVPPPIFSHVLNSIASAHLLFYAISNTSLRGHNWVHFPHRP